MSDGAFPFARFLPRALGATRMLRALRSRNYRLFFLGQGISLIGSWMTRVATAWLVYRLTRSALLLGVLGFVSQLPTFLLAPLGGVLADRWSRHRLLLLTQLLSMVQSLALAALALSRTITVEQVLLLSVVQGVINAVDIPARQSFVIDMVERKQDLSNAIALNSSIFNGARLIGPSCAGILIAVAGEGVCFLVDGLSYLAVLAALLAMRLPPRHHVAPPAHLVHGLLEGVRYARRTLPIRAILVLVAWSSLTGMSYTILLPVFAKEILRGGPHTLGFLTAASGLGALAGAVSLAIRRSPEGLERVIAPSGWVFGAALIGVAWSRSAGLSLLLMVFVGVGMILQMASSNTMLQTIVEPDKRGRIMSLYAASFMGMSTFGSLLAGGLASRLGAPMTMTLGGVSCLLASLAFAPAVPSICQAAASQVSSARLTDGPPEGRILPTSRYV